MSPHIRTALYVELYEYGTTIIELWNSPSQKVAKHDNWYEMELI